MTSTLTRPTRSGSKRCSKCGVVQPLEDFRWRKQRGVYAPRSICKPCEAADDRARWADPEKRTQRDARRRELYQAKYGASSEVERIIRPAARKTETPKSPMTTREQLADWYRRGCPL
jgi:hypothetical protein